MQGASIIIELNWFIDLKPHVKSRQVYKTIEKLEEISNAY